MSTVDDAVAFLQKLEKDVVPLSIPELTVIVGALTSSAELLAAILDRKQQAFSAESAIDAEEVGIQAAISAEHKP